MNNIKRIYSLHNERNREKTKNQIKYIDNKDDPNILKQFIFPPHKIKMDIRINIIKKTITNVINTNRLKKIHIINQ